jgi:hypothetical protein
VLKHKASLLGSFNLGINNSVSSILEDIAADGKNSMCKNCTYCPLILISILHSLNMLKKYIYSSTLLILLSCNNHFHQPLASVKKQTTTIRNYINAEDTRDTVMLNTILADTIATYWKMETPAKQKIINFYKDYWTKNKFSKNTIQSITNVAKNTYTVKTKFEVQRIQADTGLHFESTIIYKLNEANKILYVGPQP